MLSYVDIERAADPHKTQPFLKQTHKHALKTHTITASNARPKRLIFAR